ncbi:hypothetical protein [Streptantibioticus ferralitis]|uniref:Uncharacterized protein n=1 Tax=Streptantibioticus ferralitis TaxID=236510 RepID=A0ABT5ZBE0_9ACTN|nr:hypothetical protein [Streptantibioticus ferralitis]MDF2261099.1 hypothetical protein [Streptantibioticus ferralitis]
MTAVAVEISPKRPLPDELPYVTGPVEAAAPPVTAIASVADLDTVMDSVKCSCNAGDDNPPLITIRSIRLRPRCVRAGA